MERGIGLKLPDWTHTLQFRMTAGFAAVLFSILFAVSLSSAVSTSASLMEYQDDLDRFREDRTWELVRDVYDAHEDMMQVQYSLEQVGRLLSWRVALIDHNGKVLADSHQYPLDSDGSYQTEDERFEHDIDMRALPLDLGNAVSGKLVFTEAFDHRRGPIFFGAGFGEKGLFNAQTSRSVITIVATPIIRYPIASEQRSWDEQHEDGDAYERIDDALTELTVEPQLSALRSSFQKSILVAGIMGGLAGILIVTLFTRRTLSPIRELSHAAVLLGRGDFGFRVRENRKDELGQLARTFNVMASQLESAESKRRRMTADVAHELRTPLTNIRGYLEGIKDGVVKAEKDTIETLHNETLHLSSLVEDLQLLANSDAGALRLDLTHDDLRPVVQNVIDAFRQRAKEAGIDIQTQMAEDLPAVLIDRTRMAQVVRNLVDNALQHTLHGGRIFVGLDSDSCNTDREVHLEVSNSGNGLAEEDLERVFDQFYRIDASRTRATGGAGLGLTIVKRLVEAHNGSVSASSVAGKSVTFTVMLPAVEQ